MKKWTEKLILQLDLDLGANAQKAPISEERATLLYMIDSYCKHLIELDSTPSRKTREMMDDFVKDLININPEKDEKTLFRFRQYFASHRIEEYTYIQKTFDDFRNIIWDFVDQLAEDFKHEKTDHSDMAKNLEDLKESVEANSIESLKQNARQFIDNYVEYQTKRDRRRTQRIDVIKKNLNTVKQKLVEANDSLNTDHLTKAQNRRSFETHGKNMINLAGLNRKNVSLAILDIDHFKKVNDTYGHAIGDFLLQQCVIILKEVFSSSNDLVARVGGEEFAIIMNETNLEQARAKCDRALERIRSEAFVQDNVTLRFTASMGLAVWQTPSENETPENLDQLMKRADSSLYESKSTGRNKLAFGDKPQKLAQR